MISRLSKCSRFIDTFKKGSKNFLRNQSEFSLPKIAIKPSLADARNQNCFNMSTVFNLPIPGLIAIPYLVFTSNWCWWSNVTQAQFSLYFRVVSSILASASSLVFASGTCCSNLLGATEHERRTNNKSQLPGDKTYS